jgi:NAD-dependent DNA ligase
VTEIPQLKLKAADGKMRLTDCADVQTILRLIQSIPSHKAEPFKLWLAQVGYERLQETANPELSVNRAISNWKKQGKDEDWIKQRLIGQTSRTQLTDYWSNHGVKGKEYGLLTNTIHEEWTGISVKEHKELKSLNRVTIGNLDSVVGSCNHNLRDNMTSLELALTNLAEISTKQLAESNNATGFDENKIAAIDGGGIAKNARLQLEDKLGYSIISSFNNFKMISN